MNLQQSVIDDLTQQAEDLGFRDENGDPMLELYLTVLSECSPERIEGVLEMECLTSDDLRRDLQESRGGSRRIVYNKA